MGAHEPVTAGRRWALASGYGRLGRIMGTGLDTAARTDDVSSTAARRLGLVAVGVATFMWGIGSSFGAKADLPGVVVSFWRMWFAAIILLVMAVVGRKRLSLDDLRHSALMGVTFGFNICAFFITLEYINIAVALIIGALTPVVALPIAVAWMGERMTATKLVCAVVAVAGVVAAVLVAPSDNTGSDDTVVGYVWAVVSLFVWVAYLLQSKRSRRKVATFPLMACSTVMGAVTVSVIAVVTSAEVSDVRAGQWIWIVLLTIVPGLLGHGVFAWAQPRVDASVSSVLIQAEPVIASVTAWVLLDQTVSFPQSVAMAVVLGALSVLAWRESRDATTVVLPAEDPRV